MAEFLANYGGFIIIVLIFVVFIVFMLLSSRRRKKQEQDAKDLIDAVGPGNKVKTIGGVCGIVVEVDNEENTFILETGSETSGKSYIKFDKQAIYQTDAVVDQAKKAAESAEAEPVAEASESTEEVAPEAADEAKETETK